MNADVIHKYAEVHTNLFSEFFAQNAGGQIKHFGQRLQCEAFTAMVIDILNNFRDQHLIPFRNIPLFHQSVAFPHNRKKLADQTVFMPSVYALLRKILFYIF